MKHKRTQRFNLAMTDAEKRALAALANQRYQTRSEVVRGLVKDAAQKVGLWPPAEVNPQPR